MRGALFFLFGSVSRGVALETSALSTCLASKNCNPLPTPEEVIANSPLTDRILFGSDWPVHQLSLSSSL
jgi:hypothetical protein